MEQFKVKVNRLATPAPTMLAENECYKLRWFYDGDYTGDKAAGKIRNDRVSVSLTPKNNKDLPVQYVPIGKEAVVQIPGGSLLTSEVEELKRALDTASEATELAIQFMKDYITI